MDKEVKTRGKIYTPNYIVKNVCDLGGYVSGNINKKHVIDNSCGDGAFLCEILERYIQDFFKQSDDIESLKKEIEYYIHGIEIDHIETEKCKENMQKTCDHYKLGKINFDVISSDTLKAYPKYVNKMDFVLGNPPYVRVHNFGENYKTFKEFNFAQGGMSDLYLIFYEIGIKMLSKDGILSYIAPSSFFTSLAGQNFREWIVEANKVQSICDLKHFQPFNATTYTAITTIANNKVCDNIEYYEYDVDKLLPKKVCNLTQNDYYINGDFYFSNISHLSKLKKILEFYKAECTINVKNGFATLADKVFIGNFDFESKYIIKALKISTGKWYDCIFPYDESGNLISSKDLKKDENLFNYLNSKKSDLLKRDYEDNEKWYGFGRTQAIRDVFIRRISINSLYKDIDDIKIEELPVGTGCFSGLYIVSDFPIKEIKKALYSYDYLDYIKSLGKYKSGGYYTCSSKDIKQYLIYYFYKDK